jgi:hypothetical protein
VDGRGGVREEDASELELDGYWTGLYEEKAPIGFITCLRGDMRVIGSLGAMMYVVMWEM